MDKFADVLYPKLALTIYHTVLTGRWVGRNPEHAVDVVLQDWLGKIKNKDNYINELKAVLHNNARILECVILRLNYAALMTEDKETIKIYTNRRKALLFTDSTEHIKTEFGLTHVDKNATEMTLDEIERKAAEFYEDSRIFSERTVGISLDKREFIKEKILQLGFPFITDLNIVYGKLNDFLHNDYETSLIARMIYLLAMQDVNFSLKHFLE